jgi:cysteine desulfurase/selenocysteine lyase
MTCNPNTLKKDFPQLTDSAYHYLDSASSSLVPSAVLDVVNDFYIHDKANVHRGEYAAAVRATERYEAARRDVADFIGGHPDEVIFSGGATEASNMLIRSLDETLEFAPGDEIVTSVMEHHASILPLQQFAKRKQLVLKHIPINEDLTLDYNEAAKLITEKTKLLSVMLASNVIGTVNDLARLSDLAHAKGAIVISDATAAVGHIPVDVRTLGVDMLFFSGHKLLAPTGVGVLWMKHDFAKKLNPSEFGGHMLDEATLTSATWAVAPTKFEAGTKDIGGVIGLGEAVRYVKKIGVESIHAHTSVLVTRAIEKLSQIDGVHIYAQRDLTHNVGMVSFTADWAHPHDIGEIVARDKTAIRAGHHCAMPLHCELKIKGTARASFHLYNTEEDVDALVSAVKKAYKVFN